MNYGQQPPPDSEGRTQEQRRIINLSGFSVGFCINEDEDYLLGFRAQVGSR